MRNDKIYRIVGILSFIMHSCIFVFVMIVSFLPYNENKNFYQSFNGFFGEKLSSFQPIFMLLMLLAGCVFSFFAIKKPQYAIIAAILTFAFFILEAFPIAIETVLVSFFAAIGGETKISVYQIGHKLMSIVSCVIYFDFAFVLYSIVTLALSKLVPRRES